MTRLYSAPDGTVVQVDGDDECRRCHEYHYRLQDGLCMACWEARRRLLIWVGLALWFAVTLGAGLWLATAW
ncbi:MAG TPA: hypothetical protein DCQ64_16010 [Candidatus Rokubacteria bacterium]|nr:hypothetical protein [Candidatus Rokubacteria bacterium]